MDSGQGMQEFFSLKIVGRGHVCTDTNDLRIRIASRGFGPWPRFGGCLGIRRSAFSRSSVGGKTRCGTCGRGHRTFDDHQLRWIRDLSCGDTRLDLEVPIRRVWCRTCRKVKREQMAWLADNPLSTKRFAFDVGQRCASAPIRAGARELHLDWHTVQVLEKQWIIQNLWFWPYSLPLGIGNPSWGLPVNKR